MRRWFLALALLALAGVGYACCNVVHTGGQGEQWISCRHKVQLKEKISVTIPQRLAVHLSETEWDLDLSDPPLGDPETGEGCFLVPKGFGDYNGDGEVNARDVFDAYKDGALKPIATYPAIDDLNGDGRVSESEKGTLVCVNKKVLQKFCNSWEDGTAKGCEFDLKVNVYKPYPFAGSYGRMFFHDDVSLPPVGEVTVNDFVEILPGVNDDGTPIEMVKVRRARFPGWLDDFFTEGFWFDGSEVPGTYEFDVVFMLTAI